MEPQKDAPWDPKKSKNALVRVESFLRKLWVDEATKILLPQQTQANTDTYDYILLRDSEAWNQALYNFLGYDHEREGDSEQDHALRLRHLNPFRLFMIHASHQYLIIQNPYPLTFDAIQPSNSDVSLSGSGAGWGITRNSSSAGVFSPSSHHNDLEKAYILHEGKTLRSSNLASVRFEPSSDSVDGSHASALKIMISQADQLSVACRAHPSAYLKVELYAEKNLYVFASGSRSSGYEKYTRWLKPQEVGWQEVRSYIGTQADELDKLPQVMRNRLIIRLSRDSSRSGPSVLVEAELHIAIPIDSRMSERKTMDDYLLLKAGRRRIDLLLGNSSTASHMPLDLFYVHPDHKTKIGGLQFALTDDNAHRLAIWKSGSDVAAAAAVANQKYNNINNMPLKWAPDLGRLSSRAKILLNITLDSSSAGVRISEAHLDFASLLEIMSLFYVGSVIIHESLPQEPHFYGSERSWTQRRPPNATSPIEASLSNMDASKLELWISLGPKNRRQPRVALMLHTSNDGSYDRLLSLITHVCIDQIVSDGLVRERTEQYYLSFTKGVRAYEHVGIPLLSTAGNEAYILSPMLRERVDHQTRSAEFSLFSRNRFGRNQQQQQETKAGEDEDQEEEWATSNEDLRASSSSVPLTRYHSDVEASAEYDDEEDLDTRKRHRTTNISSTMNASTNQESPEFIGAQMDAQWYAQIGANEQSRNNDVSGPGAQQKNELPQKEDFELSAIALSFFARVPKISSSEVFKNNGGLSSNVSSGGTSLRSSSSMSDVSSNEVFRSQKYIAEKLRVMIADFVIIPLWLARHENLFVYLARAAEVISPDIELEALMSEDAVAQWLYRVPNTDSGTFSQRASSSENERQNTNGYTAIYRLRSFLRKVLDKGRINGSNTMQEGKTFDPKLAIKSMQEDLQRMKDLVAPADIEAGVRSGGSGAKLKRKGTSDSESSVPTSNTFSYIMFLQILQRVRYFVYVTADSSKYLAEHQLDPRIFRTRINLVRGAQGAIDYLLNHTIITAVVKDGSNIVSAYDALRDAASASKSLDRDMFLLSTDLEALLTQRTRTFAYGLLSELVNYQFQNTNNLDSSGQVLKQLVSVEAQRALGYSMENLELYMLMWVWVLGTSLEENYYNTLSNSRVGSTLSRLSPIAFRRSLSGIRGVAKLLRDEAAAQHGIVATGYFMMIYNSVHDNFLREEEDLPEEKVVDTNGNTIVLKRKFTRGLLWKRKEKYARILSPADVPDFDLAVPTAVRRAITRYHEITSNTRSRFLELLALPEIILLDPLEKYPTHKELRAAVESSQGRLELKGERVKVKEEYLKQVYPWKYSDYLRDLVLETKRPTSYILEQLSEEPVTPEAASGTANQPIGASMVLYAGAEERKYANVDYSRYDPTKRYEQRSFYIETFMNELPTLISSPIDSTSSASGRIAAMQQAPRLRREVFDTNNTQIVFY